MTQQYKIPEPPKDIFLNDFGYVNNISNEGATTYLIDHISYDNGILVYIKDVPYPRKGFVTPEAIYACNILKRVFVTVLDWPVIFYNKKRLINNFNHLGQMIMQEHILKLNMMMPVAKELHILIKTFLVHLGFDKQDAYKFAMFFSHLIEYDDAYRFRIQDIMSEITKKELLECPRTCLKKLSRLLDQRDSPEVANKFKKIIRLISLGLYIPKFKKAFIKTVKIMRIEDLQYDESDRYWVSVRDDYKFMGKTYEERYNALEIKPQGFKLKTV